MDRDAGQPTARSDRRRKALAEGSDNNPHQQGVHTSNTQLDDAVEIALEHFVGDKYGSNGLGSFVFEVNTASLGGHPKPATCGHLKTGHHDG